METPEVFQNDVVCFSPPVLLSSLPPLRPGTLLDGRYRIERFLGRGGIGAVYQAVDLKWGVAVALKVVADESGGLSKWLSHEYSVLQRVEQNAHILRLFEPVCIDHESCPLSVLPMEWADGGSLRDWIKSRPTSSSPIDTALDLFVQACRGVESLHRVNVAHLDLKPENLLIVGGRLKVADLGSAQVASFSQAVGPQSVHPVGRGTPAYRSPEMFAAAREEEIDHRSDIYSLGVILYELLDGSKPFDGDEEELRIKHLSVPPPMLRNDSGRWWSIARRCLSKGTLDRYQSVVDLLRDVDRRRRGLPGAGDAACKHCGRLNQDERALVCEGCGAGLGEVFRECPKCGTKNRLDVEVCRVCGTSVAWLFFGLDRMQRIREFSDSDPGQAIADLEEVLGLKIPGVEFDAVGLLRDVRGRMETISADLEAGERAWTMGRVREALDSWNRVLSVFPQHRSVCEKAQQAQQVLVEVESLKNASQSSLEAARFVEAQDLLRGAVSRFQGADDLRSLLAKVPALMDVYRKALAAAKEQVLERALAGASASLDLALSVAPKSEEALRLHQQTHEGLDQVRALLDRANADLDSAHFASAFGYIEQVRTVQTDAPGIEALLREATERAAGYNDSFSQGSTAFESGDLERCLLAAQAALSSCPASGEAATLVRAAEERMESCRTLLEGVESHLKAAEFDRVISDLNTVKEQWACCPGLGDLQKKAEKMQSSYAAFMYTAHRTLRKRDRNGFLGAVNGALGLCPDSQEAKDLSLRPPPEPPPPWNPDLSWLFMLVGWGGLIAGVGWLVYTLALAAAAGARKVWLVNLEDPFPLFATFVVVSVVSGIVRYGRSPYRLPIDRFASSFILPLAVGGIVGLVVGEILYSLIGLDVPNAIIGGLVAANVGSIVHLFLSFRSR